MSFFQLLRDVAFPFSDKRRRFHQPQDHIHFVKRTLCHGNHILAKFILRLVDSRCVQKDNLSSLIMIHRLNPVSRRLWLIARNRDLLSDNAVHQRRLPDIGSSYQRHKSRFKRLFRFVLLHLLLLSFIYNVSMQPNNSAFSFTFSSFPRTQILPSANMASTISAARRISSTDVESISSLSFWTSSTFISEK